MSQAYMNSPSHASTAFEPWLANREPFDECRCLPAKTMSQLDLLCGASNNKGSQGIGSTCKVRRGTDFRKKRKSYSEEIYPSII